MILFNRLFKVCLLPFATFGALFLLMAYLGLLFYLKVLFLTVLRGSTRASAIAMGFLNLNPTHYAEGVGLPFSIKAVK